MPRALLAHIIVLGVGSIALGEPPRIFDVQGRPPERVTVCLTDTLPAEAVRDGSPMLDRLDGILGGLTGGDIGRLRGTIPAAALSTSDPPDAQRLFVLHLHRGEATRRIDILRGSDGFHVAKDLDATGPGPHGVELDRHEFERLCAGFNHYRGDFTTRDEPGVVFELSRPYEPGWFTLDLPTIQERLNAGRAIRADPTSRECGVDALLARLPQGYDPRVAAGLLVWVDAGPEGAPPRALWPALDELGVVAVGAANSGNHRHVNDRYQLALDAVATVCARYLIDESRIYVCGISGGGRIASTLVPCFGDVFAGAVPIVGLACHEPVPEGTGRYFPANYRAPRGELARLARTRRVAAITCSGDFNHAEIINAARLLTRAGRPIQVLDFEGLAHEMPSGEQFAQGLRFVDEPRRTEVDAGLAEAMKIQDDLARRAAATDGQRDDPRARLIAITRAAPWSIPAWEAVARLRSAAPPSPAPPAPKG